MFLPHPRVKVSIVGSLRDREVACSVSDRQGSNFDSCVWRTVSSQSSHHSQEVLLAQFSLYVHKGGLKPDSFHFFCSLIKDHVLTKSASLTFWQIALFYIYIYRCIYIYITRPTISNYRRKKCIPVSCRVFIVKMCGSLTCLCFRYFFFDEKRGEYECIAVAHHQDTGLLQTGPWCITMYNKSAQLRFKA